MPDRIPDLTPEQRAAAITREPYVLVEAAPGSGKTTVAAERFGALRFTHRHATDDRGVVALSFTRSAAGELGRRIAARWGRHALEWPNRSATLDTFYRDLVAYLLCEGLLTWPGGWTELTVIDSWPGHLECRWAGRGARRWVVTVGRDGIGLDHQVPSPATAGWAVTDRDAFLACLTTGTCTHAEIRQVLAGSLADPALRAALKERLTATVRAVVLDEVFDCDELDLNVVELLHEAEIPVTAVGDRRQALYEFRGAKPEETDKVLRRRNFVTHRVSRSFRFESDEMRLIERQLEAGNPLVLQPGGTDGLDVVLASRWESLWAGPDQILPVSFGPVTNPTEAAFTLLLQQVVVDHTGHAVPYLADAVALLCLNPDRVQEAGREALAPVVRALAVGSDGDAVVLGQLSDAVAALAGRPFAPIVLDRGRDAPHGRIKDLRRRLGRPDLVHGMSVHQAKGREWHDVGLILKPEERGYLKYGLRDDKPKHRPLYVAVTRARRSVRVIPTA